MIEHIEQGTLAPNIRACIALTSWKKRINTVGLTIYNLFETCGPDYHIVLTLAEEEFPKKEQELPRDLVLMNKAGVFEILWVKKNYRAFKKWLFCSKRYQSVPIISADDDCIYTCNYANELYNAWTHNKMARIGMSHSARFNLLLLGGCSTINPPHCFSRLELSELCKLTNICEDDMFYSLLAKKYHIPCMTLNHTPAEYVLFCNDNDALSAHREYGDKSDYYKFIELFKTLNL